jgi:hypothetical protein
VKQTPDISEAALLQLVQESVLEADALFGPAFRKQTRKVCACERMCYVLTPPPFFPLRSVVLGKVPTQIHHLQQPHLCQEKVPLQLQVLIDFVRVIAAAHTLLQQLTQRA